MAKEIKLTYEDKDYTLAFTRKTVVLMENAGFNSSEFDTRLMTMLPMLFKGAFLANHRGLSDSIMDAIWEKIPDKEGIAHALIEMYNEPIEAFLSEPKKGKVDWKKGW